MPPRAIGTAPATTLLRYRNRPTVGNLSPANLATGGTLLFALVHAGGGRDLRCCPLLRAALSTSHAWPPLLAISVSTPV